MLYLFIFVFLFFLSYHYDYRGHTKGRLGWYLFCLTTFALIGGLRYRIGVDTIAYEEAYNSYLPTLAEFGTFDFETTRFGAGFIFFAAIARSISENFVTLQLLHSFFVNSIIFWFLYKNTRHIFLGIALYFWLYYPAFIFEIMRESCAVCMFLVGWQYFLSNKWWKYYFYATLAVLFHPSAAIVFFFPILYLPPFRGFFKLNRRFWLALAVFAVGCAVLSIKFFDLIRLVELADIQTYADEYESSDFYGSGRRLNYKGIISFFLNSILYVGMFIFFFRHKSSWPEKTKTYFHDTNKLEFLLCVSMYISVAALFIRILYRFNNYTALFVILAFAEVMYSRIRLKRKNIKLSFLCWMIIILPYLGLKTYGYFGRDRHCSDIRIVRKYYPYRSVFNPVKDEKRERLYGAKGI